MMAHPALTLVAMTVFKMTRGPAERVTAMMLGSALVVGHDQPQVGPPVYYRRRNNKFRDVLPNWREPLVEKTTAFRDR